ncbi:MAG: hypothetical protein ACLROI_10460 [Beduini sp.]|uniref:hypothetical protein n=1 Tax=Beduini sp. TaxID=1922300 RepID=UPI0039907CB6
MVNLPYIIPTNCAIDQFHETEKMASFPILSTSTATGALTILSKLGGELSMGFVSFLQLAMSLV